MNEELRHISRVSVCCRAVVLDRYGLWTAVTEDVSRRGCRIRTTRLLRPGSPLMLTLSSDLFSEELEAIGEVKWSTAEVLGVLFTETLSRPGALSPEAWIERVLEHGATGSARRIVPVVQRPSPKIAPAVRFGAPPPKVATGRAPTLLRLPRP